MNPEVFYNDYHSNEVKAQNVAGIIVSSSESTNKKPVIISNDIEKTKQIDSSKLSITDIVFDNNSYENGVLSVSGKVLYTY